MKKLVYFIVILLFVNCTKEEVTIYNEMKSDTSLSEFFTDSELKELSKIIDFFEREIGLDKSKSKEACYFDFNKKTIDNALYGNKLLDLQINYKKQQKLFSEIDSLFLKEIWRHHIFLKEGIKSTGKAYDLNQFGKYMLFLESLKEEDVLFRGLYEHVKMTNEISFGVNAPAFYQLKKKEFKGIKRKFFFAIYYLTLNDKINNITKR